MKLTAQAIRFRTSVLVFTALLVVAGIWSYATLPKEASPSIEFPVITITTLYPGASPPEVEALVTFPIERELQGLEGLEEIQSVSREGVSAITVEFRTEVDRDDASRRVRERVDLARVALPAEADEPRVREIDFEELPILTVNLLAPYPLARLKSLAEALQDEIEAVTGVLEAEITGGVDREVQVNVDVVALQAQGISFDDVARAIERENVSIPGGTMDVDRLGYQVRVDGRIDDAARIADLVIDAPGGRPVFIRDVAEVVPHAYAAPASFSRLRELRQGDDVLTNERAATAPGTAAAATDAAYEDAISLFVRARAGENIIETVAAVERVIERHELPPGTRVVLTGDRSETVVEFIEELENHIVFGVLLVTLSLLFFLGLKTALLAAVSIPLTLLLAFIIFRMAGETLNFIILFSLIIVLGILVDFAIIVVENVHRHMERGGDAWASVQAATAEVAWPVTAGLATSAAVFVPLLFWGGLTGEFLQYIPITLIVTLASALFVALVIIPVIAGYTFDSTGDHRPLQRRTRRLIGGITGFIVLVILLANPAIVLVLAFAALLLLLLYRHVLEPGSDWFRRRGLPAVEARYRELLTWSLQRDYSAPRAFLRNVAPFAAFAVGFVLIVLGGVLRVLLGTLPALPALVPGALLLLAGAIAILVLFVETLLLGGRGSVKAGLVAGALLLPLVAFNVLRGSGGVAALLAVLLLPGLMVAAGMGGERRLRGRRQLVLTDNRARVLALTLGGALMVGIVYAVAPTGTAFFPDTDPNQIIVRVEAPVGTRIEAADRITGQAARRIDALIARDVAVAANIRNIVVTVGVGGEAGGALLRAEPDPRRGQITLNLVDYGERAESSTRTLEKLRAALDRFPDAQISFEQDRPGPPVEPPVQIEIAGPEFERVAAIAADVEARLRAARDAGRLPGLVDLSSGLQRGQPELRVRIDRDRAALFGLSTQVIAATVRAAVEGRVAGSIRDEQEEYDIRVRLREEDRATLQSLELLRIAGPPQAGAGQAGGAAPAGGQGPAQGAGVPPDGGAAGGRQQDAAMVPLVAVADLEIGSGLGAITRLDLQPLVTIEGDAATGFSSSAVLAAVQRELAGVPAQLPAGYSLRYAGEVEEQQEEFAFLGMALVFGLGLIMLVLVTKFNAIGLPLIILIAVGLTMTGVVLGLIATRTAFSLFTFLGIISLAGIVADDDIVLAEFIEKERDAGKPREQAIIDGAASRFRQVTLTAVTTIVGLVPLTFGLYVDFRGLLTELRPGLQFGGQNTQFWGPLGGAIIAGLPVATAVTLVVVPVVYSTFDSLRRHGARMLRQRPADEA
jgi:multidrug efflux pump